jgi:hypothetical protein
MDNKKYIESDSTFKETQRSLGEHTGKNENYFEKKYKNLTLANIVVHK